MTYCRQHAICLVVFKCEPEEKKHFDETLVKDLLNIVQDFVLQTVYSVLKVGKTYWSL